METRLNRNYKEGSDGIEKFQIAIISVLRISALDSKEGIYFNAGIFAGIQGWPRHGECLATTDSAVSKRFP